MKFYGLALGGLVFLSFQLVSVEGFAREIKPPRMLRFWRGFKQDNASQKVFEAKVNSLLIPQTTIVGAGKGLLAYLPSFFLPHKPNFIPDEIAIVDYESEEKYTAIRSTDEGKAYGALHFEDGLFAHQNAAGFSSGSLVAQPYSGVVEVVPEGRAYLVDSDYLNWQKGVTVRRTLLPVNGLTPENLKKYISEIRLRYVELGLQGFVIVVDQNYVMMMLNYVDGRLAVSSDLKLSAMERGLFSKFDLLTLENQEAGHTRMRPGLGINVQFETCTSLLTY